MYELTGDPKYQEWGWEAFSAIDNLLKSKHGYASCVDVRQNPPKLIDRMESFFLSETLKYHYLLQVLSNLSQLLQLSNCCVVGSHTPD